MTFGPFGANFDLRMALTTGYTSHDDYVEAVAEAGLFGWEVIGADDAADKLQHFQPGAGEPS